MRTGTPGIRGSIYLQLAHAFTNHKGAIRSYITAIYSIAAPPRSATHSTGHGWCEAFWPILQFSARRGQIYAGRGSAGMEPFIRPAGGVESLQSHNHYMYVMIGAVKSSSGPRSGGWLGIFGGQNLSHIFASLGEVGEC